MKTNAYLAALYALAHIAFVVPFVPAANVLPASLGMISMTSMAGTLVLSARWRGVDRLMGGPDKSYVLHRWLGFFALAGALGHWALASSLGEGALPVLSESGEEAGPIAAMGLLILSAAAMVRAIPYHLWKLSHMLMGPVFVLATYHTFLVASPLAVGAAPWVVMAIAGTVGLIAWGQTLLRKATPSRLVKVSQVTPFEGGVDVTVTSDTPLPAYRPGQFATLAHNRARAEAHPFTIAGGDSHTRRFVIRAAGDWTNRFATNIQQGDDLRLGRGVGRFLPRLDANRPSQLWVAGGVGITPFLATLEAMAPDSAAPVHLVYFIRSRASAGVVADVEHHAARLPQVSLTLIEDGAAKADNARCLSRIVARLPKGTHAYICGPEGLKDLLRRHWETHGHKARIHSERFDFRGAYALTDLVYIGKPVWNVARRAGRAAWERAHATAGS
ncbi:MAG: ferric reductase-like transmembrane domain-containing protein [Pelagimonas sp.]|jgi:predicted ferric reductase|nr:ferric reductase-like transmembrane domain-containing protein [Pelagimonas sp.]